MLMKTLDNDNKWQGKCLTIGGNVLVDELNRRKCSGMCGVSADLLGVGPRWLIKVALGAHVASERRYAGRNDAEMPVVRDSGV